MIDRSTAGVVAEPDEVEAVLHNLCGYHLAERDPLHRYSVLTREQALYGALVAAIKRERGRALAELAAGRTLTQVGQITGLGSRQRVQRLIAIARAADEAATAAQTASIEFEEQLALATVDFPMASGSPATAPIIGPGVGLIAGAAGEVAPGSLDAEATQVSWSSGTGAVGGLPQDSPAPQTSSLDPVAGAPMPEDLPRGADATEPDLTGVLEPTLLMPALTAVLEPTKEFEQARDRPSTEDDDIAWWRHEVDTGAA